jgi:hypothetical protein
MTMFQLIRTSLCVCVVSAVRLYGQGEPAGSIPYRLEWRHHFDLRTGLVPVGTADESGTLWLITRRSGPQDDLLTKIDSEGKFIESYNVTLPLKPIEWVSYLSPAVGGRRVGLLASLTSGGQQQTFEGAFFVPVGSDGLGNPVRIANAGPQFPTLIGAGSGQFIAAGDQEPLTLVKVDASGKVLWRRSFSSKLILPEVSIGNSGDIFVVSQGGEYILLQMLNPAGRVLRSRRIIAKQGTVVADSDGGCSILFTKGFGGNDNTVFLLTFDRVLRQLNQGETPLVGHGRTYQLIAAPNGHVVIGESSEPRPATQIPEKMMAEIDKAGKLIWQQTISSLGTPLLAPFRSGFYVVWDDLKSAGMNVEKYIY